jgi:hypothetical protein
MSRGARPAIALAGAVLALGTSALALAGCLIEDPYNDRPARGQAAPDAAGGGTDARPPRDPRAPGSYTTEDPRAALAGGDAVELAAAYARAAGNWSWRTYARQFERMLALAGGSLRSRLSSTPPTRYDLRALRGGRQANRAVVVATDVEADGEVIVVTRERAAGGGTLAVEPVHHAYRATVGATPVGPRVVEWERLP